MFAAARSATSPSRSDLTFCRAPAVLRVAERPTKGLLKLDLVEQPSGEVGIVLAKCEGGLSCGEGRVEPVLAIVAQLPVGLEPTEEEADPQQGKEYGPPCGGEWPGDLAAG